ncbi:MAG: S8 family serine peptidase, partial [Nocardioides sp.]
ASVTAMRRDWLRSGLAVLMLAMGLLPQAAQAAPGDGCLSTQAVHTGELPWALRRLAPQRSWPLARGQGVTVAVLGSGIDARNPQFAPGQVLAGRDFLTGGTTSGFGGRADNDCDGSGTFVAGLIGAQPSPETTVVGLAPDVTLLPVRVGQTTESGSGLPSAGTLADAINYAATRAEVIVIYNFATDGSPRLRRAISQARQRNVVVVAGGSALSAVTSTGETTVSQFPCGYETVIAVGGLTKDGQPVDTSCQGPRLDLAAPGTSLISTAPMNGAKKGAEGGLPLNHQVIADNAPGYAAGYVAAAAALLLSYEPALTPDQVEQVLLDQADHNPDGARNDQLGQGILNPYASLTAVNLRNTQDASVARETRLRRELPPPRTLSPIVVWSALGCVFLAVLIPVAAATVLNAARRRWRPGSRQAGIQQPGSRQPGHSRASVPS